MSSTEFRSYGERGPGKWITIYAREGHTFAVIAGLRLDTTPFDHYTGKWAPVGTRLTARPVASMQGIRSGCNPASSARLPSSEILSHPRSRSPVGSATLMCFSHACRVAHRATATDALCAEDSARYRPINLDLMAGESSLLEHQYAKESFNRSSFNIVAIPGGAVLRCRTGKSHVTSEQVTHAVQELEKLAQQKIQENAVPGLAIAVVFQDKVVYAKGFGVRDVNTKAPVDADTVFQLASVSKPIGSTVVAELVGEGKITWDSKLSALDPTFEMFDPWVTRANHCSRHVRASERLARSRWAICSRISALRARKFYFVCVINVPIAVFVRITRTRILA